MSPVAQGTGGLTAAPEGTAQGQTVSLLLSLGLSPGLRPGFNPGLSPGLSELVQPLELCLVERVETGTVEGGRVEFVADLAVVPQLAGHTAGGGAAPRAGDQALALQH